MKSIALSLCCAVILFAMGCAAIKVTRPGKPANQQGFKVYAPKPYILVARAGEAGKVISVSSLILPDLIDPHLVRQQVGMGKANLTFTIENGVLKTFGGDVDSKIPETLKEIGGLATSYGTLVQNLATAGKTREETANLRRESADLSKREAAAAKAKSAAKTIDDIIKDGQGVSSDQKRTLEAWRDGLLATANAVVAPVVDQAVLDEHAKKMTSIAADFEKATPQFPEALRQRQGFASLPAELRAGAKEIATKPPEAAVFELYEVIQPADGTPTTLNRVLIP